MSDRRTQLENVIQTAIDSALKEVHTCLPAVVTAFTPSTQLIDAQITIKRKLAGDLVLLPMLRNVPIRYPRSSTFSLTFPIEIGDHVMIIFSERSIDTWLTQGGIQDPFDFRKFDLSDAFAIPSMYPQTDVIPNFDPSNFELKTNSGDTKIIIKPSEDISIETTGDIDVECENLTANVNSNAQVDCDTAILNAITAVNITSPLTTISGNLTVTGQINTPIVQAATSLTVNGKEMDQHTHPQGVDSDGDSQQNTGGPN